MTTIKTKKQKMQKQKLEIKDYKKRLEATQLENKIKQLQKTLT